MAALGLDPFRFLESRDAAERALLIELHDRAIELKTKMDENLAGKIAQAVGKLFK